MKRLAAIVGISLTAVLGIGAFVLSSNDSTTAAKRPAKTAKPSTTKTAANKITSAPKVESESPTPPTTAKKGDDAAEGYEAKKAFVGVSPAQVKAGEKIEIEIRGFAKSTTISVNVAGNTLSVKTDKNGKAQVKATVPKAAGTYTVDVTGTTGTGTTTTLSKSFKVVVKK